MGSVGIPELIVIFILALIVFGPKRLPELGRTIAKALTEFRRASADLRSSFEQEMSELERHTREIEAKATEVPEPEAAPPALAEGPIEAHSIAPPQEVPPALGSEDSHAGEKPSDAEPKPA